MVSQRFRPSGVGSFFGNHYIYDQVVPQAHSLRQLKDLIPWEELTKDLLGCYQGGAEYGPILIIPPPSLGCCSCPTCITCPSGRQRSL